LNSYRFQLFPDRSRGTVHSQTFLGIDFRPVFITNPSAIYPTQRRLRFSGPFAVGLVSRLCYRVGRLDSSSPAIYPLLRQPRAEVPHPFQHIDASVLSSGYAKKVGNYQVRISFEFWRRSTRYLFQSFQAWLNFNPSKLQLDFYAPTDLVPYKSSRQCAVPNSNRKCVNSHLIASSSMFMGRDSLLLSSYSHRKPGRRCTRVDEAKDAEVRKDFLDTE
jgi:hypothetical protein